MHEWLNDAIFYEIYPQSFCDSNADGIGDIPGIISRLDYIQGMGFNAIWMNPCFDSPFVDAGYDVRDYYKVAPRYGTNQDLKNLFIELHKRGMHILLDLVPGHTSSECKWFVESCKAAPNEYTDRYIWSNDIWSDMTGVGSIMGTIRGGTERNGQCAANFFNAQPALNYGFARIDEGRDWEQPVDAPGPMATREAIKNVMRFWLDQGCDGFRIDMAGSLVKNDDEQKATIALWQDFRAFLDAEYPEAAIVSEWGEPNKSLIAGYHMDFLLHFGPSHYLDLFRVEEPFFSRRGKGDCKAFFDLYLENKALTEQTAAELGKEKGLICIPSGNHDMVRIARTLDQEELKIAYAFLMSMPGVPFVYYGDEIGEHYVEDLYSVEGGYERTGSRSPMAFDRTANAGFSAAPAEDLYIAQDASIKTVNAETQSEDPDSLLNELIRLIQLRKDHPALGNRGEFTMIYNADHAYPLVYERTAADGSEKILVVLNPADAQASIDYALPAGAEQIYAVGTTQNVTSLRNIPGACALFYRV